MPLLADGEALRDAVDRLAEWAEPRQPGHRARRGGARLHHGRRARLPARLRLRRRAQARASCPWHTVAVKYALEYGFDTLELHADAISGGQRVLIHDDVLATGGTAKATVELVEQLGGEVVGLPFLIELDVPERAREARGLRRLLADPVLTAPRPPGPIYLPDVRRADEHLHALVPEPRREPRAPVGVPGARAAAGRRAPGRVPDQLLVRAAARSIRRSSRTTSSTGRRSGSPRARS